MVTINSNGSENEILIGHKRILQDSQEMVEEGEQQVI